MELGATGPTISNQLVGSAMVLDYEGDGYDDLVVRNTSDNVAYQLRSNGEGLQAPGHIVGADAGTFHVVGDANGDGMFDEYFIQGSTLYSRLRSGVAADLLTQVTDGLGNTATFTYKRLNDPNGCYSRDVAAPSFPVRAYFGPTPLVCSLTANNGVGGHYTLSYSYWNADLHLQGRRFLGFAKRQVVDSRNNIARLEEYSTDYSHYERLGAPLKETLRQSVGGAVISEVTNSWSHHTYASGVNERRLAYISQSVAKEYELDGVQNGALIRTTTTTNSVDYTTGVAYDSTSTTVEGSNANGVQPGTSYVQRTHQPVADLTVNTLTWCIGRPRRVEISRSHDQYGGSQLTRAVTLDWDEQKCRPIGRITQPGDPQWQVSQVLVYDEFGNLRREDVTGGMTTRWTSYGWGTDGHFLTSVTNALNQTTTLTWDALVGMPKTLTDPNQLTFEWDYDAFGRRVTEKRPDGTSASVTYEPCSASVCPGVTGAKIVIKRTERTTALATIGQERVYLDAFERPIVSGTPSLSGADTRIAREYDALGRVKSDSAPCWWSGCTPEWTLYDYDRLDRLIQIARPMSDSDPTWVFTRIYYEGLTTRVVDGLNKQTTKVANAIGATARSADHSGYAQSFDYDSFGNPIRVTDTLGATLITNTFNVLGMRTAHVDRAAGGRTYVPNAFGEITSEVDGNGQTTSFEYDLLGRLKRRIEAEGTSEWTWGTSAAAKNIGRLAGVSGPGYSEGYAYDAAGRLQQTSISADASSHVFNYGYNDIGALSTLTYPVTTSSSRLKLEYEYQNGVLARVKDFDSPSTVYWAANSTDAAGHVIDETLGNGVHTIRGYDTVTGAIDYIQSGVGGGTAVQNLNYFWNEVGNLKWRQDANLAFTETFTYDDLHRLHTSTGPDPTTIDYDARGNILSRSDNPDRGGRQTMEWTSYDLPRLITGETGYSSQFSYTPDRGRWKQVAAYGGTSETTLYIGGLLEKTTVGGSIAWKHYIVAPSGPVALQIRTASSTQTSYLSHDHLGSVDAVTNAAGSVVTRMSYGIFGQRRNATAWSGDPTAADRNAIANTTRDGFTGHAMLDNLSLIHMNGRVFDPLAGNFLSADPFVPQPALTQSFNRYAYVRNNPLSLVDPSGYQERTLFDSPFDSPDGTGAFDGWLGDYVSDIYYDTYVMRSVAAGRQVGTRGRRPTETDDQSAVLPASTVSGTPLGVPDWASTSGVCLGGCHGTSPDGPIRPMTPEEALVLNVASAIVTLPLGGELVLGFRTASVFAKGGLQATRVTEKGIARIERHLTRTPGIEPGPAELRMIERLRAGSRTSQDLRFYQHELMESRVIAKYRRFFEDPVDAARGAHHETLIRQGLYRRGYESELYSPDALRLIGE